MLEEPVDRGDVKVRGRAKLDIFCIVPIDSGLKEYEWEVGMSLVHGVHPYGRPEVSNALCKIHP